LSLGKAAPTKVEVYEGSAGGGEENKRGEAQTLRGQTRQSRLTRKTIVSPYLYSKDQVDDYFFIRPMGVEAKQAEGGKTRGGKYKGRTPSRKQRPRLELVNMVAEKKGGTN